jgi:hypothetical protein
MNGGTEPDQYEMVLAARVVFQAALVVCDSEDARVAWRFYHHALANDASYESIRAARRLLDEAVIESGDEQLVDAKRRYDVALRGSELTA